MTFTDYDLKQLKDAIVFETEPYMYRIHKDEIKALLARLEAGEKYIDALEKQGDCSPDSQEDYAMEPIIDAAKTKFRKAAGK